MAICAKPCKFQWKTHREWRKRGGFCDYPVDVRVNEVMGNKKMRCTISPA